MKVSASLLQSAAGKDPVKRLTWVSIGIRTCLLLALLSGIITTWLQAAMVGLALCVLLVMRERRSLSNTRWGLWLQSVPLTVRFGAAVLTNYLVATVVLTMIWDSAQGLWPVLFSVLIGLAVYWLLMPGAMTVKSRPSNVLDD
jgi:hypothetical protein